MTDDKTAYITATGRVLRNCRESLGLSVADLAGKSGLPQLRIEQIEAGSIRADANDLLRLATGLNTPVERFTRRIDALVRELLQKKQAATQSPDLREIHDQFLDAYSIVYCAAKTLYDYDGKQDDRAAILTLHQGVDALTKVLARLDEAAAIQVAELLNMGVGGKRGTP
jgi:transcriptional regulator with XRE-family HTH domain